MMVLKKGTPQARGHVLSVGGHSSQSQGCLVGVCSKGCSTLRTQSSMPLRLGSRSPPSEIGVTEPTLGVAAPTRSNLRSIDTNQPGARLAHYGQTPPLTHTSQTWKTMVLVFVLLPT